MAQFSELFAALMVFGTFFVRGLLEVTKHSCKFSANRNGVRPQTPSAEDINDLAKDDYIFDATSCGLKGG